MTREKIGVWLHKAGSCLFLAAVVLFVWTRNHFYNFGVYSPTVKPSDVLLFFSLNLFLLSIILSREVRSDKERNEMLIRSTKVFCLFLFFLGLGLGSRLVMLKLPFTHEDIVELGRILLGFTGLFLTIAFAFRNERFTKLVFLSFLANIVLIPLLFFPVLTMLKLLLVVSPVGYTFLGFQNSTIIVGFSVMITLALMFSLYAFARKFWFKALAFAACCLLAAILLWTGSRAGWMAAFVAMASIVLLKGGGVKKVARGIVIMTLMFVIGFSILSPLARNTAIVRIFPHLNVPLTVDRYLLFQLPTREFIKNNNLIFDVGFRIDRGDIWKAYALNFAENPTGIGSAYWSALGERNFYFRSVGAHSLWLQSAMSGGIGELMLVVLVFIFAGREAWRAVRRHADMVSVGLFGAFCGVLIEVTLIDSLDLRWLWVFLGLIIVRGYNVKTQ